MSTADLKNEFCGIYPCYNNDLIVKSIKLITYLLNCYTSKADIR